MSRLLVLSTAALLGCPERAPTSSSAPVVVGQVAADGGGVTAARLDAWLAYHKALGALAAPDGGALDARAKAKAEREIRRGLGLTEGDLDQLETLIAAVVAQRTISRLTGAEAVREFERVTLSLKPEQRQKVEQAFGDVRTRAAQTASLDAERARFGEEAVSLVLAREAELTATWDSLLDGRGERR
ncbi:MAG: hypothetical protein JNJ54_04445 [Myxococcaceae bacterium]|nr:hypothetical protein [Myxococcaceae bacterium]